VGLKLLYPLTDLICLGCCFLSVGAEYAIGRFFREIALFETSRYQSVHYLVYWIECQLVSISMITFILWFKLLHSKMQAFRSITILLSAIRLMLVELASFFWIMLIVCVGFGTSKFLLHGSSESRSFTNAIGAEFWLSIKGDLDDSVKHMYL
jgi:hypothetical protein